jgi:hypothetical protein
LPSALAVGIVNPLLEQTHMITVTLQFATLAAAISVLKEVPEAALAAQTMVVEPTTAEMTSALQAKNAITQAAKQEAAAVPKSAAKSARSEPTAKAEAGDAQEKMAAASSPSAGSAVAEQRPSTAANDIPFEELKKVFLALGATTGGREKCEAILKPFGVERLSKVDPSRYAEVMAALKAA